MNVQLIPEPFVEIPVELADEMGIRGTEKIKVISARGTYIAKAFVTRRIKPMMIDGKKVYQIGLPIHQGFRGITEDEGRDARTPANLADADGHRSERLHPRIQGLPRKGREGVGSATMSQASTEIVRISGHAGTVPGAGLNREFEVCKLMDTTTCIGCKACEVACLEWNGYTFSETTFDNSYQTMPETAWNYWNLIKFNEHEREDGTMMLLMRKDQCMHCEDPGCLAACPADGAIVQYANGIVDFQQKQLHRLRLLHHGLPVQYSEIQPDGAESFQMHAVQRPRVRGTRTGLHQVVPHRLSAFRHEDGNERTCRNTRDSNFASIPVSPMPAFTIRPASAARTSFTSCTTPRIPKLYGGLPKDPHIPWTVQLWKGPLKWLGNLAMVGGVVGLAWHYMRFGPKKEEEIKPDDGRQP